VLLALVAWPALANDARPPVSPSAATAPIAQAHKLSPYRSQKLTDRAKTFYAAAWGVDKMKVSYTSSGNLIRFSYRVSDPERAKELARKQAIPYLVGQKNNVVLQVPTLDNIGQMRQTAAQQAGQEYWMVFSNKGDLIRRGDRVNVNIGQFHADGLLVE
jgi:hypothetical protein